MNKIVKKLYKRLNKLKTLMLLRLPDTPYHKKAWLNYEKILLIRANMY